MDYITRPSDHAGTREDKHFKTTLFRGDALMLGLNCLESGQTQAAHSHAEQDKFYYVIEGEGRFQVDDEFVIAGEGQLIWAPAGVIHGVTNESAHRLTVLVGIAPAP